MSRELLEVGDRIWSIREQGEAPMIAGKKGIISIAVNRLPGPMGFYAVAVVCREEGPDQIFPLHMLAEIQVSNP